LAKDAISLITVRDSSIIPPSYFIALIFSEVLILTRPVKTFSITMNIGMNALQIPAKSAP